jgi:hypothetical protein
MGTFLIVLGSLVAILCGGCTLLALSDMGLNSQFSALAFLFGGVPFAIGICLLLIGLAVNKRTRRIDMAKKAAADTRLL